MSEMTLLSRHRIRNSNLGGLSTLTPGHGGSPQYGLFTSGWGRTPNSSVKGSGANHYPRDPAHNDQRRRRWADVVRIL